MCGTLKYTLTLTGRSLGYLDLGGSGMEHTTVGRTSGLLALVNTAAVRPNRVGFGRDSIDDEKSPLPLRRSWASQGG